MKINVIAIVICVVWLVSTTTLILSRAMHLSEMSWWVATITLWVPILAAVILTVCIIIALSIRDLRRSRYSYKKRLLEDKREMLKEACTQFFYYWYNQKGNNTEQGFDTWMKTEEGREMFREFVKDV